ncbi:hypothetical protein D9M70_462730 [compost metagenome]
MASTNIESVPCVTAPAALTPKVVERTPDFMLMVEATLSMAVSTSAADAVVS